MRWLLPDGRSRHWRRIPQRVAFARFVVALVAATLRLSIGAGALLRGPTRAAAVTMSFPRRIALLLAHELPDQIVAVQVFLRLRAYNS